MSKKYFCPMCLGIESDKKENCPHCGMALENSLPTQTSSSSITYTCPMHLEIDKIEPGNCPICGMALKTKKYGMQIDNQEYRELSKRFLIAAILTLPIFILAMGGMLPYFHYYIAPSLSRWLQFALSVPVVFWAGSPFFKKAWISLTNRRLNMFSLISLGIATSFIYSLIVLFAYDYFPQLFLQQGEIPLYFETATIITVLALLGQVLESKARAKTGTAIQSLLERAAKTAWVICDGQEKEVAIDEISIGAILRVRPGEKVPLDGKIVEGHSTIDESMVTGESIPIKKMRNDSVIGGTINQTGSFLLQVEKTGNETLLFRIIHMVSEAQKSRAPIQGLADKVATRFVPIVAFIALMTFIIWASIGPQPSFVYALMNAVAVLVIACPCALGLATPMSIMVGMGRGAEAGILIKDADALEKLEKITVLVVDKTGTLTEGKPKLSEIITCSVWNQEEVLALAAAIEQHSEHPLAATIIESAKQRALHLPKVDRFESITGYGVMGIVNGQVIAMGKALFLQEKKIKNISSLQKKAIPYQQKAQTIMFIAINGEAAGFITVNDPIKSTTSIAIDELHRMGVKIVVLSGDNEQTTKGVAEQLKIDEYHGNVDPQYKQDFVKELKKRNHIIAMAGDGINDAPALAEADVGIAMGSGTDIAMESAGVTLVKGDLVGIVRAIQLSRSVMRNIRQNLFFAFIYNMAGIPIAAGILFPFTGILLNPIIAAFAMSFSSLSVIANALRLRKIKYYSIHSN